MEITLEQIELVKDRTGSSYKEAKEALEFSNGNVIDAIIYIEENLEFEYGSVGEKKVTEIVSIIKEAINTGNVTKITIYKDDELILNLPITVGAVATIVFPWAVIVSAVAAAATKCRIEIVTKDGEIINVGDKATMVMDDIKDKGSVIVDEIKTRAPGIYENAKQQGAKVWEDAKNAGANLYNEAVNKGTEVYENAKGKVNEFFKQKENSEETSEETGVDDTL